MPAVASGSIGIEAAPEVVWNVLTTDAGLRHLKREAERRLAAS